MPERGHGADLDSELVRPVITLVNKGMVDETLRMVVDCTPAMRAEVERLLEGYHALGTLSYGLHVSDTALMTCFVQNYNGRHLHFIDGGDGGYAFAARGLKERIRHRQTG